MKGSDDNVVRPDFNTKFAKNEEMAGEIWEVVTKYHNQVSLAEVVGVLDIVKSYVVYTHLIDED